MHSSLIVCEIVGNKGVPAQRFLLCGLLPNPSLIACLFAEQKYSRYKNPWAWKFGGSVSSVNESLLPARLEPLQPYLQSVLLRRAIKILMTTCKSDVSEEERLYYQSSNGVLFSLILSFPPLCAFSAKMIRDSSFGPTNVANIECNNEDCKLRGIIPMG